MKEQTCGHIFGYAFSIMGSYHNTGINLTSCPSCQVPFPCFSPPLGICMSFPQSPNQYPFFSLHDLSNPSEIATPTIPHCRSFRKLHPCKSCNFLCRYKEVSHSIPIEKASPTVPPPRCLDSSCKWDGNLHYSAV
jgi:hypothetical protein